jgi:hypothetical protein
VAHLDPAKLAAAGFTDLVEERPACGVFSIAGLDASGKTHWAFTAPDPIGYMGVDFGTDGVIQKFGSKQIVRPIDPATKRPTDYKIEIPFDLQQKKPGEEAPKDRQEREKRLADFVQKNFIEPWRRDYEKLLSLGVRTVIFDTASEVWEWTRISVFGRGATNRDDLNALANAKWREMVRLAGLRGANLILIHQLKPEFESYEAGGEVKWRRTGGYEVQGNAKNGFLVTAAMRTRFVAPRLHPATKETLEEGRFELTFDKIRDQPPITASPVLVNADFVETMMVAMPDVDPEKWM